MGTESRQRTARLLVRLRPDEIDEIRDRADQAGVTAAGFVRLSCLSKQVGPSRSRVSYRTRRASHIYKDSADLLAQLSRVGNNLNQLAYIANSGQFPAADSLEECLKKISDISDKITCQIIPSEEGENRD